MKVKRLIKLLKKQDKNADVLVARHKNVFDEMRDDYRLTDVAHVPNVSTGISVIMCREEE